MTGLAAPVSRPPRPSPSVHTPRAQAMLAASATRLVRRHIRPAPMASWMIANAALNSAGLVATRRAPALTAPAIRAGLPAPAGARICVANPRVNM